jgi:predicted phage terminase large subunit-like protein
MLQGYSVKTFKATQDKVTRALPVSSQAEAGNVKILQAPWNEDFLRELENFPEGGHDDIVDALSGAFLMLTDATYDLTGLTKL